MIVGNSVPYFTLKVLIGIDSMLPSVHKIRIVKQDHFFTKAKKVDWLVSGLSKLNRIGRIQILSGRNDMLHPKLQLPDLGNAIKSLDNHDQKNFVIVLEMK